MGRFRINHEGGTARTYRGQLGLVTLGSSFGISYVSERSQRDLLVPMQLNQGFGCMEGTNACLSVHVGRCMEGTNACLLMHAWAAAVHGGDRCTRMPACCALSGAQWRSMEGTTHARLPYDEIIDSSSDLPSMV